VATHHFECKVKNANCRMKAEKANIAQRIHSAFCYFKSAFDKRSKLKRAATHHKRGEGGAIPSAATISAPVVQLSEPRALYLFDEAAPIKY
jgi:hypothetical protein